MSNILLTLPLDQQWRCQYYRGGDALDETQNTAIILPLSAWTSDAGRQLATLDRAFALKPIEAECVRYWLLIDSAPDRARVLINHKPIAEYRANEAPFELDVTNFVMLGVNWIMFRVEGEATAPFAGVRLVAVPCE
jgi:hypothetical protein